MFFNQETWIKLDELTFPAFVLIMAAIFIADCVYREV